MLLDTLTRNTWAMLAVWTLVYCSDYGLTLVSASLHRRGAGLHSVAEQGIELNPAFREDIAKLRILSPRFVRFMLVYWLLIWCCWTIAWMWNLPALKSFLVGFVLLNELAVHHRHVSAIITHWSATTGEAGRGRLETSHWLSQRTSAVNMALFGLLWLAIAPLARPWFFLGGAVGCWQLAWKNLRWARRAGEPDWPAPEQTA